MLPQRSRWCALEGYLLGCRALATAWRVIEMASETRRQLRLAVHRPGEKEFNLGAMIERYESFDEELAPCAA